MTTLLPTIADVSTQFTQAMLAVAPILADKSYNYSWGLVIFLVALGLLVALTPTKRTSEVKKPKD